MNQQKFKLSYKLEEDDLSNVEVKLFPEVEGEFFVHILLGNTKIKNSPQMIKITKSDE